MNFLSRRVWLLVAAGALFAGGALGVACSNGNGDDTSGGDSGKDATTDTKIGNDGGPGNDTGPGNDSGPPATCEAGVSGECDVTTQNCGPGKDCLVVPTDGGGYVTQCVSNTQGSLPEGTACNQGNSNPCVPGLECIAGRCAKHCCSGNDSACGSSKPEGFPGRCDLNVTPGDYYVCSYSSSCEPFGVQPCATGQGCYVKDSSGTATCSDFSPADAGEGVGCQFVNDCNKDGLGCYGSPDGGGFTCQWNCYVPPGPFDAGIAQQGAGKGGCPNGETCKAINWNGQLPTWLGLCGK